MPRSTTQVLTLLELLQSGGTRTMTELAGRLGVDPRTVRRYVDHLAGLGVPVESVRGRHGGYRLGPGYRMPPLMLNDDEALAVLLGLVAGRRSGLATAAGPAAETAAAKVRRVLPDRVAARLDAVLGTLTLTGAPARDGQGAAPDAEVLLTIADAVRHRRPALIRYTDASGQRSERTLHPYGLVSHAGRWYVPGADSATGQQRTFRLDRIASARALPGTFEAPAGLDPAQLVVTGLATAPYRHHVIVWVQGTAQQVRAQLPASIAVITGGAEGSPATQAGWLQVEIRAERLDWLPGVLASLGLPFTVEQPAELRDAVRALAQRLLAAAAPPSARQPPGGA